MAVLDRVTIAYRGARYEIGRGRHYFGLWTVDAPRSQPLEWWPETQEGWSSAWARFSALETPDTITPAGRGATRASGPAPPGLPRPDRARPDQALPNQDRPCRARPRGPAPPSSPPGRAASAIR